MTLLEGFSDVHQPGAEMKDHPFRIKLNLQQVMIIAHLWSHELFHQPLQMLTILPELWGGWEPFTSKAEGSSDEEEEDQLMDDGVVESSAPRRLPLTSTFLSDGTSRPRNVGYNQRLAAGFCLTSSEDSNVDKNVFWLKNYYFLNKKTEHLCFSKKWEKTLKEHSSTNTCRGWLQVALKLLPLISDWTRELFQNKRSKSNDF